jgi:hypothetical protein
MVYGRIYGWSAFSVQEFASAPEMQLQIVELPKGISLTKHTHVMRMLV